MTSRPIDETAPLEAGLPAYYIGSVGRALTLLSVFGARSSLTVSEAAQLLGVAPSTAHRLLQMLVHHGFIVQGERREYLPGPSLRSLSSAERATSIQVAAEGPLRALRDAVSGTAQLLALEGNGARFLAGCGFDEGIAGTRIGWLLPAHTLAGGQVLLAQLSTAQLEALYPDGPPPERDGTVVSLPELQERLAKVRQRGYALGRTARRQVCAAGVAIPFHERPGRSMALSVAWPTAQFPLDDVPGTVRQLRATADVLAGVLS